MLSHRKLFTSRIKKYCSDFGEFSGRHRARYVEAGVPQHIVSRAFQGMHLLRPDKQGKVKSIIYGVIAKALNKYTSINLYNFAFLSNHAHFLLSAKNLTEISRFMGYVLSQISKRLGCRLNWNGPLWQPGRYAMTALPVDEACEACFEYILAQGTKEGLVACPKIADHTESTVFSLKPLPCWKTKSAAKIVAIVGKINNGIIINAKQNRGGKPVLEMDKVYKANQRKVRELPKLPWHERKSVIVAWSDIGSKKVRAYIKRYWAFQVAFLEASIGEGDYPPGAWIPGGVLAAV